ncbi:MAG: D-aminoacyl-tRNA deacylase [Bacteroidales bacterium]|nr:D-aminoacyl-tRNA deacylase [Bacteroidales bacterium]
MKVVIQRVKNASVTIDGKVFSEIGGGLLVLLGISPEDAESDVDKLASKTAALRIFDDENGVMNRSVMDTDGDLLVVSQFTLMASWKKGNRPSYIGAARHEIAIPLYEYFCKKLEGITGKSVQTGVFGADMKVALVNDGPVTIIMDTKHPE